MLPDPLHPAVVHFPIVFVMLLPLIAVAALVAIRRGARHRVAWAFPLALAAGLTASAWVAVKTGEAQEERVEDTLASEAPLHGHEEAAERFLLLSGVLLLVAGAGMAGGRAGRTGRALATAGAFGLVVAGAQVGHSGGQLVYRHGAAAAYAGAPGAGDPAVPATPAGHDD